MSNPFTDDLSRKDTPYCSNCEEKVSPTGEEPARCPHCNRPVRWP